jgi:hypothetical protein
MIKVQSEDIIAVVFECVAIIREAATRWHLPLAELRSKDIDGDRILG